MYIGYIAATIKRGHFAPVSEKVMFTVSLSGPVITA